MVLTVPDGSAASPESEASDGSADSTGTIGSSGCSGPLSDEHPNKRATVNGAIFTNLKGNLFHTPHSSPYSSKWYVRISMILSAPTDDRVMLTSNRADTSPYSAFKARGFPSNRAGYLDHLVVEVDIDLATEWERYHWVRVRAVEARHNL